MTRITSTSLIADYNYFWKRTRRYRYLSYKRPIEASAKNKKLFAGMKKWCHEQGFNPRLWLYSLFMVRRWVFPPKLNVSELQSQNHIKHFNGLVDFRVYRKMIESELAEQRESNIDDTKEYDPNRDLSNASEGLKNALVAEGNTSRCIARMDVDTFGYHPKSTVCLQCPNAVECAGILIAKYPFDILALRKGEITSSMCKAMAKALRKTAR